MGYRIESILKIACDNCTNWANFTGDIGADESFEVVEDHLLDKAFNEGWELDGDKILCRDCTSQAKLKADLKGKVIQSVVIGNLEKRDYSWQAHRFDIFMEDGTCLSFYSESDQYDAIDFSVTT